MKASGMTKKMEREIEAAAEALGFPRRVSQARVERELSDTRRGVREAADLDCEADRPRFLAVASLCLLMDAAQRHDREVVRLRKELSARVARMRGLARIAA